MAGGRVWAACYLMRAGHVEKFSDLTELFLKIYFLIHHYYFYTHMA